ncbi:protocadherin Fat 4-like [Physella acuta]|uniref:protocadherin Fat 4-like n=1 Tax=Physella acuta TaxID=109671 RepID=UPI0027DCA97A|nr:protocadherin Fat 4-like [Physella acuta]
MTPKKFKHKALGLKLRRARCNFNSTLKVNTTTGQVTLNKQLDFDLGARYLDITVEVSDLGTPSLSTTVMLGFRVSDCDDYPPVFTPSVFTARVRENADVGTLVLYLSATDADSPNTELSRITFGFESPCSKDWFKIDQYTGAIFVKELLDWETAPNVTCQVYAYSSTKFADRSKTVVTISLDDINDRAPEFTKYLFEGSVVENAVAGTFVMNVKAVEYEYGLNGIFKYSMPDNSTFAIDANSGAVTLTGSVDYEQDTIFLVLVQAADEGTPSLTSQTFVNIKVLPVNEFTPVLKALAAQNILENIDPGTEIVQVSSTDADHGDDGKVLYYLQDPNVPFILKQETGMLSASSGINAEVTDHYDLVILAVDQSKTTKRTGTTTLRVNIVDVNDNPPLCQPVVPVVITAPFSLTSPVVKLSCSDADLTGKTLSYREVGGDPTDIFSVNSLDGTIKLNFLDDQTVGVYKILYEISDSGDPSLTSTLAVKISIRTNLKFTSLPTGINIYENASLSQILYNVTATGTFEFINYAIKTGNDAGYFNLHQTLGTLRLVRELDRETSSSFTLGLTATTPSGLVTTSTLAITVLDCNDNAPKFSNSFYSISLSESLAYPTTVKTITAKDSDFGDNAVIKYSIISGNTDNTFIYDPNSGNLILQKALNFEQTPGYSLTLLAVDQGTPQLSSTTIVFVTVVNENEPRPIVISPGYTTTLTLSENTAVGANVLHITAGDPAGETDLRYSLANESVAGSFSIDERLGDVYLNYELDRETNPSVIFDVRVTNVNGQSNTTHVIITVSDVNDNDPQFGTGNLAFTTPHGTPPGVVVEILSVTDPDEGSNADLTLSIVSGNNGSAFTITGSSLTTSTRLDANVQDTYTLVVMATDAGNPQRSSSAYVTVLVEPEVKPPKFVPNSDTISVEETRTPGSMLYDLDATAAGARENQDGDLIYSVKSGNSNSTFNVEGLSGGIQLAGPLSYSRASVYNLVVTARNIKNISVSDEFTLTITVLQVNLHAPMFSSVVYSWVVDETAAVGTAVGQVLVTDDDLGLYGTVTYNLTPSSTFIIDTSGRVILNDALEYSTTASYNLVVIATDNAGVNSLSSSCLVLISVKDSNNHAPVFTVTTYDVTIPETLSTKETFFSVWATDLDSAANGISGYKIISGNVYNTFIIDNTGALQLNLHLDYESVRKYTLTVAAVDSGGLSGTAQVTVNVLDENDYVPYFDTHVVDIAVDRDTRVSTPVFTASAVDRDAGQNGVVRYVIKSGNDDGLFSIDVATGVVKTAAALDKANQYQNLIVYGIDRGLPALTGTLTLGITLTPVLSPPSGDYSFSVKENLPVGTYVGTILANAPVTVNGYKITSGNYAKSFSIIKDATTRSGLLKTNKILDREDFDIYQLVVEVLDTSGTYTGQYVVVEVMDQNDNAPTFDSSTLQITTVEHLASGHVIGRVGVTDKDGPGVNSEVDLSISPLTPIGSVYFSIDSAGDLTLKQALNHDVAPTVVVYIVATDRGAPKLSSTGTVTVTVADVKETASNSRAQGYLLDEDC